jgi:hypothetical protein
MKKILFVSIMLLTLLIAVSSVSAAENATDVASAADEVVSENIGESVLEEDVSNENANDDAVLSVSDNSSQSGDDVALSTSDNSSQSGDAVALSENNENETLAKSDENQLSTSIEVEPVKASNPIVVGAAKSTKKATSKMATHNSASYDSFKTKLTFKLTAGGKNLANKRIKISVDGKRYVRITDSKGIASIYLTLKKGCRFAYYIYSGDSKTSYLKGKFTVCTWASYKTYFVVADEDINYRAGSRSLFGVYLWDSKGEPVKYKQVVFRFNGKIFKTNTDGNGYARMFISPKEGYWIVTASFFAKQPYLKSSIAKTIYARPAMGAGNGYWVFSDNMYSVDFGSLKDNGCKQVLLHVHSISVYGRSAVESWIADANSHGIKVHLWMQICYGEGGWVSPVNDDGSFKWGWINDKISEAVEYAKMPGVAGVHLDYVRYGGTAHNHINAVESINYIVKKAATEIHKVRAHSIVSIAVMPEPDMMHYYYGQDIPTLSKYVDAIIPMAYRGNYEQSNEWLTYVTNTFVKQSNGAQIWCGLQGYESDSNAVPLSHDNLLEQARYAKDGGAKGSIIFRHGYSPNVNFYWV